MFSTKRRQIELESLIKKQFDEERSNNDTKAAESRRWKLSTLILSGVLAVLGVVLGALISVYGPGWVRQERLGVAPQWDFFHYAGPSAESMPSVGDNFDSISLKSNGAQAFMEGQILISLTAQKDRNHTFTDVRMVPKETVQLPKPSWVYVPPPTTGGGPSIHNVELSLDLDTGTWTNLDRNSRLQPGVKFDPFILASENFATIRIWVKGSTDRAFSIVLSHQAAGDNEIKDAPAGDYVVYGIDPTVPHFTSDQENKIIELAPITK